MAGARRDKAALLKTIWTLIETERGHFFRFDDENVKEWRRDVRVFLTNDFSEEPKYLEEFDSIQISHEHFEDGLGSYRVLLRSLAKEINTYWDLRSEAPNVSAQNPPSLPANHNQIFVIHGRQLRPDFHDFLRALGLTPLEWSQARKLTNKPTPYRWEIVDAALHHAGAIVELLTPDDEAGLAPSLWTPHEDAIEKEYHRQPRQNVLFEAGVAYGRAPERTVLIRVGSQRPMSDLAGHHILQLDNTPQARQAVADALQAAGCTVNRTGSDWFNAGEFVCIGQ